MVFMQDQNDLLRAQDLVVHGLGKFMDIVKGQVDGGGLQTVLRNEIYCFHDI